MWDTAAPTSSFITPSDGSGKDPWYPTSREKRARYGAPGNCGRDREEGVELPNPLHAICSLGAADAPVASLEGERLVFPTEVVMGLRPT